MQDSLKSDVKIDGKKREKGAKSDGKKDGQYAIIRSMQGLFK
jgi:hypothetical protein